MLTFHYTIEHIKETLVHLNGANNGIIVGVLFYTKLTLVSDFFNAILASLKELNQTGKVIVVIKLLGKLSQSVGDREGIIYVLWSDNIELISCGKSCKNCEEFHFSVKIQIT